MLVVMSVMVLVRHHLPQCWTKPLRDSGRRCDCCIDRSKVVRRSSIRVGVALRHHLQRTGAHEAPRLPGPMGSVPTSRARSSTHSIYSKRPLDPQSQIGRSACLAGVPDRPARPRQAGRHGTRNGGNGEGEAGLTPQSPRRPPRRFSTFVGAIRRS